jgi:hypothetical protein
LVARFLTFGVILVYTGRAGGGDNS